MENETPHLIIEFTDDFPNKAKKRVPIFVDKEDIKRLKKEGKWGQKLLEFVEYGEKKFNEIVRNK